MEVINSKKVLITDRCNFNCYFCNKVLGRVKTFYSDSGLVKLLKNESTFFELVISGGEPLLLDSFFSAVKIARRFFSGRIGVETNGFPLLNNEIFNKFKKNLPDFIVLNIFGDNKYDYKKITGKTVLDHEIKDVLERVKTLETKVVLSITPVFENVGKLKEIFEFALKNLTNFVELQLIRPLFYPINDYYASVFEQKLYELCDFNIKFKKKISVDTNFPSCFYKHLPVFEKKIHHITLKPVLFDKKNICISCPFYDSCKGFLKKDRITENFLSKFSKKGSISFENSEGIALKHDLKKGMRLEISGNLLKYYTLLAKFYGYFYDHSHDVLNNKTVFYVSKLKSAVLKLKNSELALKRDDENSECEHHKIIGKILSYPSCCTDAFCDVVGEFSSEKEQNFYIVKRAVLKTKRFDPLLNHFFKQKDTSLISHFPCSYDCENSISYAKKVLNLMPDKNNILTKLRSKVIFLKNNSYIIFKGKKIDDNVFIVKKILEKSKDFELNIADHHLKINEEFVFLDF